LGVIKAMLLPPIEHCVLCEDIRIERRNLFSLMGVYGFAPWASIRIRDFSQPVFLAVAFFGGEAEGTMTLRMGLRASNGAAIKSTMYPNASELTFSRGQGSSCGFKANATFPGPGVYSVYLLANEREIFRETFVLEQATPSDFLA
jgi:hypothetical protein